MELTSIASSLLPTATATTAVANVDANAATSPFSPSTSGPNGSRRPPAMSLKIENALAARRGRVSSASNAPAVPTISHPPRTCTLPELSAFHLQGEPLPLQLSIYPPLPMSFQPTETTANFTEQGVMQQSPSENTQDIDMSEAEGKTLRNRRVPALDPLIASYHADTAGTPTSQDSTPSSSSAAKKGDGKAVPRKRTRLPTEKRKAQNRSNQRAFRERRETYIKDLEVRYEQYGQLVKAQASEIDGLRQLAQRLEAQLATLQAQAPAASNALGLHPIRRESGNSDSSVPSLGRSHAPTSGTSQGSRESSAGLGSPVQAREPVPFNAEKSMIIPENMYGDLSRGLDFAMSGDEGFSHFEAAAAAFSLDYNSSGEGFKRDDVLSLLGQPVTPMWT